MPACYRHPSRETGVSCSNCGRPICPDCMTPTSVGMRCPECAGERTKVRRMPQGVPGTFSYGGFLWNDPRTWTVTQGLIIVNVICFLAELATGVTLGGSDKGWVFWHGVLYGPAIRSTNPIAGYSSFPAGLRGSSEYWRLVTSGFLHQGILHIGMNMLSLYFVGRSLEPAVGKRNFALIYFTGLLAGSFGALVFTPLQPTLGASTAIFAIFGALIVVAHARRIGLWQTGLLPILLLNLVFTLSIPDVSVGGHLGGLAAGLITGRAYVVWVEHKDRRNVFYAVCVAVALVSVVGAVIAAGGTGIAPNGLNF